MQRVFHRKISSAQTGGIGAEAEASTPYGVGTVVLLSMAMVAVSFGAFWLSGRLA